MRSEEDLLFTLKVRLSSKSDWVRCISETRSQIKKYLMNTNAVDFVNRENKSDSTVRTCGKSIIFVGRALKYYSILNCTTCLTGTIKGVVRCLRDGFFNFSS